MKIILDSQITTDKILDSLIEFESMYGSAVLMSSKASLSKIKPIDIMKRKKNVDVDSGFLVKYGGYECIAIPNLTKPIMYRGIFNSDEYLITTREIGYEISRYFNEVAK